MSRCGWIVVTWVAGVCALGGAPPVHADGMFAFEDLDPRYSGASAAQVGIIRREGAREVLLLQTTYRGPATDFAWIVPVPRPPLADEGLFTASRDDIEGEVEYTRPLKTLDLPDLPGRSILGLSMRAKSADEGADGPVRVLSRKAVGEYDASVLQASDAGCLAQWLRANGYRLPEAAKPAIAGYVEKGWVFVAMRVLDWVQAEKPVLDSVTPVGIRFQAETLVFPLAISRASAPPKTTLLLLVYDHAPVCCPELPVRHVGGDAALQAGDSYEQFRERLATGSAASLVCEGLVLRDPRELRYIGSAPPEGRPSGPPASSAAIGAQYWVTRLWGRVDRDQMVDLTFIPDREERQPYRLDVELGVPPRTLARLERSGLSVFQSAAAHDWRGAQYAGVVVAALGWIALRRRGSRARLLLLAGLVFVFAFPAAWMPEGLDEVRDRWLTALRDNQASIGSAVDRFVADTGAYPVALSDLSSGKAVVDGLDASGNRVRLARPTQGTYLSALPTDPLTGRSDTWLYWVSGEVTVQSSALTARVKRTSSGARSGYRIPAELSW